MCGVLTAMGRGPVCGQNLSVLFQGKSANKTGLTSPHPEFGSGVMGCLQSVVGGSEVDLLN